MKARGQDARFIGPVDDIVTHLARALREGDRVVILSNGGFGGIHNKLLAALGTPASVSR
jgi:UDP-N-acetylmuramate: L-alanyl-gamma-D-glutamyl-meso-diaminopimelate ligase